MTALLESLAANETRQTPAMEEFMETLTALVLQYEEEIHPVPESSPSGVLKFLMEEHNVRAGGSGAHIGQQVVREPDLV